MGQPLGRDLLVEKLSKAEKSLSCGKKKIKQKSDLKQFGGNYGENKILHVHLPRPLATFNIFFTVGVTVIDLTTN